MDAIKNLRKYARSRYEKKERDAELEAEKLDAEKLIMIFLVACLVGYGVEEIWCLIRNGYFESRHSLIYGPLSVLYGMGAVLLTLSLYKIKDAGIGKIFLTSFLVCSAAEYIASLGQEICFGSVAWDYSDVPLNINGRICLLYSLFWGVLGVAWIKGIYPALSKIIDMLPKDITKVLCIAFSIFFVFDCAISACAGARMDQRKNNTPPKNRIEEFLDEHYPDERMREIYANSKDV